MRSVKQDMRCITVKLDTEAKDNLIQRVRVMSTEVSTLCPNKEAYNSGSNRETLKVFRTVKFSNDL